MPSRITLGRGRRKFTEGQFELGFEACYDVIAVMHGADDSQWVLRGNLGDLSGRRARV